MWHMLFYTQQNISNIIKQAKFEFMSKNILDKFSKNIYKEVLC